MKNDDKNPTTSNAVELDDSDLDQVAGGLTVANLTSVTGGTTTTAIRIKGFADSVRKTKVNESEGESESYAAP